MRLRPFFCFYGGKHLSSGRYPGPEHNTIVEPFAGSAGYATRYHDRAVVLVERDEVIASLWRFLVRATRADIMSIPLIGAGESTDDVHGPPEARALVGFWLNRSCQRPRRTPSSWMRSGLKPRSFWGAETREVIAAQVDQIRHWRIIGGDYSVAPDIEATWFIDPPYMGPAGRHYAVKPCPAEYDAIGAWTRARRGMVIACENEGASWLPFAPLYSAKAISGRKRSPEAVWIRGSRLIGADT